MRKMIIIFGLLLSSALFAQTTDPYQIIDEIKSKYDKINDYEVKAIM